MSEHRLARTQFVPRPLEEVFAFYSDARNLARITPAWLGFSIRGSSDGDAQPDAAIRMREGVRIHYRVRPLGLPQRWTSEITAWEPPHRFVDEQRTGPYRRWRHIHEFRPAPGGTQISDVVEYALPFGPLGDIAHSLLVKRQLKAIFDYRERVVASIFG